MARYTHEDGEALYRETRGGRCRSGSPWLMEDSSLWLAECEGTDGLLLALCGPESGTDMAELDMELLEDVRRGAQDEGIL